MRSSLILDVQKKNQNKLMLLRLLLLLMMIRTAKQENMFAYVVKTPKDIQTLTNRNH